jgi:hypothetical protein
MSHLCGKGVQVPGLNKINTFKISGKAVVQMKQPEQTFTSFYKYYHGTLHAIYPYCTD